MNGAYFLTYLSEARFSNLRLLLTFPSKVVANLPKRWRFDCVERMQPLNYEAGYSTVEFVSFFLPQLIMTSCHSKGSQGGGGTSYTAASLDRWTLVRNEIGDSQRQMQSQLTNKR